MDHATEMDGAKGEEMETVIVILENLQIPAENIVLEEKGKSSD